MDHFRRMKERNAKRQGNKDDELSVTETLVTKYPSNHSKSDKDSKNSKKDTKNSKDGSKVKDKPEKEEKGKNTTENNKNKNDSNAATAKNKDDSIGTGKTSMNKNMKDDFGRTETEEGSKKDAKQELVKAKRVMGDKGYFLKAKVRDLEVHRNLFIAASMYTSYSMRRCKIGEDFNSLQECIDSCSGQHVQHMLVQVPPGLHNGRIRIDCVSSVLSVDGVTLGLRIVGDNRVLSGLTLTKGDTCYAPIGSGAITFIRESIDSISVLAGGHAIDLEKFRLTAGDHILISTGEIVEKIVARVNKNRIFLKDYSSNIMINSITFSPNCVIAADENTNENLLLVGRSSVTFHGIRFSVPRLANKKKYRSLAVLVDKSTVNFINCMFDDLYLQCKDVLSLMLGSTVTGSEVDDSEAKEAMAALSNYPITLIGGSENVISMTGISSIIDPQLYIIGPNVGVKMRHNSHFYPDKSVIIGCKKNFDIVEYQSMDNSPPSDKNKLPNKQPAKTPDPLPISEILLPQSEPSMKLQTDNQDNIINDFNSVEPLFSEDTDNIFSLGDHIPDSDSSPKEDLIILNN